MTMILRESDNPRTFMSKFVEYVQKPAWPSLKFLKDNIRTSLIPDGGHRVEFEVRSGVIIPFIYTIQAVASNLQGLEEELVDYDHIGPLSTDGWVLEIRGWEPQELVLTLGIMPFEIRTDQAQIVLKG